MVGEVRIEELKRRACLRKLFHGAHCEDCRLDGSFYELWPPVDDSSEGIEGLVQVSERRH